MFQYFVCLAKAATGNLMFNKFADAGGFLCDLGSRNHFGVCIMCIQGIEMYDRIIFKLFIFIQV